MAILSYLFRKRKGKRSSPLCGSYTPSQNQVPPPPPPSPCPSQPAPPVFYGVSGIYNYHGMAQAATGLYFPGVQPPKSNPTIPPTKFILDTSGQTLFNQRIPQEMLSKFTVNGKNVMLKQSDYKASGGEGVVYVKGNKAYKIYHDPKKMIPVGKIQELSQIKLSNVLAPEDTVYVDNTPTGFVMPAVSDTEFLCKLFTKGFRDRNNIKPDMIAGLVSDMQITLNHIHTKDILVVDYNEMNFLVSKGFDTVYNIDVDSWQTPSYPATAIMESIRDRKVVNKKFTKESDWFSFACVAFQLYIGTHPYKSRHPDFSPKDWLEMMDKGISVFNKKSKLPPACQTLDVIPKGHLKWFEAVFEKGERTAPPKPDHVQVTVGPVVVQIISSTDTFNVTLIRKYDSAIEAVRYIDGICFVATKKSISGDGKLFTTFSPETGYVAQRTTRDFVPVQGDKPALVEHNRIEDKVRYRTFEGKALGEFDAKGFFIANRALYTVVRDSLIEVTFRNTGVKVTVTQQSVANVFHNNQIFDGLVIQNMLGTCRFSIPFESGKCQTVHIKELDKSRIVDARYDSGVAIVMAEHGGKYQRHVFVFSGDCQTYTSRVEQDASLEDVNFAMKDNGVVIAANGDKLEIFADNSKVKQVDSPLSNNEPLVIYKNDTMLVNGDSIYKISSK